MKLIEFRDRGLYCTQADVYIDPWKPVKKALITHGHSDHARPGHQAYACVHSSKAILQYRLGKQINITSYKYGEKITINGVTISFHPAGHIVGSAQIRLEYKGQIWVISGDYKIENDGISEPYEQLRCTHFITECTFGLPVYHWNDQQQVYDSINNWWAKNKEEGKVTILTSYALGKAQRVLHHLDPTIGTIYAHGAIENTNEVIRNSGVDIISCERITPSTKQSDYTGAFVITTPSSIATSWIKRFKSPSIGMASGWMALRGARRRRGADRGFVLSDHADWPGLLQAINDSEAEYIYPTHGYTEIFSRYLSEQGYKAIPVKTEFTGETIEEAQD